LSPEGSQLAACCSGHGFRIWDLHLIRQQLADMGLDWDLPPYSSAAACRLKAAQSQGTHGQLTPSLLSFKIFIFPVP
jgi:hypothetical protein